MAKKPSRTRLRELALERARQLALPERCDVVVAGGGAAGLVAAISAAEAGALTVVLERDLSCGHPLLATGGGRCNFSNRDLLLAHFRNPELVGEVFGAHPLDEILGFFADSGLAWAEEDGRLYPRSMQASSVRDVLLARAERAGVVLGCARGVASVEAASEGFELAFSLPGDDGALGKISCSSVVLATGRHALDLASLGVRVEETSPVLCPLAATGLDFAALDGRRAHAELRLARDGAELFCERGELQFRDFGISGIVSFDLSRVAQPGDVVTIDLIPELGDEELERLRTQAGSLVGVLDPAIASALGDANPKQLEIRIEGPADPERAQALRGGIAYDALDGPALELAAAPGIFACGECVDVDADCGGYNLSWAWLSGMRAGAAAARAAAR